MKGRPRSRPIAPRSARSRVTALGKNSTPAATAAGLVAPAPLTGIVVGSHNDGCKEGNREHG